MITLMLALQLAVTGAYAYDYPVNCYTSGYETVCRGDKVITSGNYIGTIQELFSNGRAQVALDGYSGTSSYDASALSRSTRCTPDRAVCEGDTLITSGNYTGRALLTFQNGKVQVTLDGYSSSSIYTSNNLAREAREYDRFTARDRILTSGNYVGTINNVYENGKAKVTLDGYSGSSIYNTYDLGRGVYSYGGFYQGDRIITSGNYPGNIVEIFTSGKATVKLDGYSGNSVYNLSTLSSSTNNGGGNGGGNYSRLQPGDRIITSGDYTGVVKEVFSNGKIKVTLDGYSGLNDYNESALSKAVYCTGRVCTGDRIITSGDYTGLVKESFENGKVKISLDGYSSLSTYTDTSISRSVSSYGGFYVGQRIITSGNYTGKIVELFDNRRAKVSLDGYSGLSTYSLDSLSR